jgi:hypothetical protein
VHLIHILSIRMDDLASELLFKIIFHIQDRKSITNISKTSWTIRSVALLYIKKYGGIYKNRAARSIQRWWFTHKSYPVGLNGLRETEKYKNIKDHPYLLEDVGKDKGSLSYLRRRLCAKYVCTVPDSVDIKSVSVPHFSETVLVIIVTADNLSFLRIKCNNNELLSFRFSPDKKKHYLLLPFPLWIYSCSFASFTISFDPQSTVHGVEFIGHFDRAGNDFPRDQHGNRSSNFLVSGSLVYMNGTCGKIAKNISH